MGMITFRLSAFEGRFAPVQVCPKSPPSDRHSFTSLQGIHIYIYICKCESEHVMHTHRGYTWTFKACKNYVLADHVLGWPLSPLKNVSI